MSTETINPLLFRISILGDEGIGKDKFINLFTTNQFLKESDTGLGVAFYKGSIMLDTKKGQQECIIWIWDLKEREGYKTLQEGDSVEFDVVQGPKGEQAANVKKLS